MSVPDLSVIIPVYNRGELISYTLESVQRASAGLSVEIIVVDDGSDLPVITTISQLGYTAARVVRQSNQGLLSARLTGLFHARGNNILFLDSDDLVGPEKFHRQLAAMDEQNADVSYTDTARVFLTGDFSQLKFEVQPPSHATDAIAEFFIRVQPPPHSPIYRAAYLKKTVEQAFFPPSNLYNNVAEIWFYYNAAPFGGRVTHVPGPHTIVGFHPGARLTNHWEKLGVAALAVLEAFLRSFPETAPQALQARQLTGEAAFRAWRALPRGTPIKFSDRLLGIWKRLGGRKSELGGPYFQLLARALGPVAAARWMPGGPRNRYSEVRTMPEEEFLQLVDRLPAP